MAGRVLEIGKLFPGLRLVPVVTEQEERIYKNNGPSQAAGERKRRLDAAGSYEVVPDTLSSNKLPCYHQKFIERCDQIIYSMFRVPQYIRDDFARKVRMKKGRQPLVRYVMQGVSLPDPVSMEPMIDLQQSIEYVRRSGFRLLTDKLPQELLEKWLANADLPNNYMEFGVLEGLADVFGRQEGALPAVQGLHGGVCRLLPSADKAGERGLRRDKLPLPAVPADAGAVGREPQQGNRHRTFRPDRLRQLRQNFQTVRMDGSSGEVGNAALRFGTGKYTFNRWKSRITIIGSGSKRC